jgi:hypothetical protein
MTMGGDGSNYSGQFWNKMALVDILWNRTDYPVPQGRLKIARRFSAGVWVYKLNQSR